MVKMEKVQAGVAKFIDRDIAPSLSGWDKVIVAAGGGLLAARLPQLIAQYAAKPIIAAMGVYDAETGEVDIDALYAAAKPYMGTEPLPLKSIPCTHIFERRHTRDENHRTFDGPDRR